jgi:hypothetical protein
MNQLPIFLTKELTEKPAHWISYDTQEVSEFYTGDPQTVALEVNGLVLDIPGWWKNEYPNAYEYFRKKESKLVVYYGKQDWISPHRGTQGTNLIEGRGLFIWWQVENVGVLTSIAESLSRFNRIRVRVDLLRDDEYFDRLTERHEHNKVHKLSVNFGDDEDFYAIAVN